MYVSSMHIRTLKGDSEKSFNLLLNPLTLKALPLLNDDLLNEIIDTY